MNYLEAINKLFHKRIEEQWNAVVMSLPLFLRKRRVLLVIFLCSLTYFILATFSQLNNRVVEEEDIVSSVKLEEILRTIKPPIEAGSVDEFIEQSRSRAKGKQAQAQSNTNKPHRFDQTAGPENTSDSSIYKCRNSVQGRAFIADENGYICDRFDLQVNGCCKVDAPSTKRYKCDNCTPSGCCALYEQCVSCCLHPQKVGG